MLKRRFHEAWFAPVLGFAAMLIQPAVGNASTSGNLLVNGDAELQLCTNDWTAQTSIPGWRVIRGAASVLCYSAFNFARVIEHDRLAADNIVLEAALEIGVFVLRMLAAVGIHDNVAD